MYDGRVLNYNNNTIEKDGVIIGFITNDDVPGQLKCGCEKPDVETRTMRTSHASGLTVARWEQCWNCDKKSKPSIEPRFA